MIFSNCLSLFLHVPKVDNSYVQVLQLTFTLFFNIKIQLTHLCIKYYFFTV